MLADYDVRVNFRPLDSAQNKFKHLLYLGVMARDALGRLAPQCQQKIWILDVLVRLERRMMDPCVQRPKPRPGLDFLPFVDPEMLETLLLGSAVLGEEMARSAKALQPLVKDLESLR